jgi:hypothetical protein
MSWAANRKTSRIEDQAYSLLGIFGVNMPLLYGEGEMAFIRLQEEIIKTSYDQTIFAWEREELSGKDNPTSLLAPAPRYFENGRRVIQWWPPGQNKAAPFFMTNHGLSIDLPLTPWRDEYNRAVEGRKCAILRCRYEDNFIGPIALDVVLMDVPDTYSTSICTPRLLTAPLSSLSNIEPQSIIIQRKRLSHYHDPTIFSSVLKFHLFGFSKSGSMRLGNGVEISLSECYPSQCWSEDRRVLCVRVSPDGFNEICGAIRVKIGPADYDVFFAQTAGGDSKIIHVDLVSFATLRKAIGMLSKGALYKPARDLGFTGAWAHLVDREVMGETVTLVMFTTHPEIQSGDFERSE